MILQLVRGVTASFSVEHLWPIRDDTSLGQSLPRMDEIARVIPIMADVEEMEVDPVPGTSEGDTPESKSIKRYELPWYVYTQHLH